MNSANTHNRQRQHREVPIEFYEDGPRGERARLVFSVAAVALDDVETDARNKAVEAAEKAS